MTPLVWDASAVVKLVVEEPGSRQALGLHDRSLSNQTLDWTTLEVANALRKRHLRTGASEDAVIEAFVAFRRIDFERFDAGALASAAFALALRHRHSVYDCAYIALARDFDATLVTADAVQREVAEAAGVEVIWIDSTVR